MRYVFFFYLILKHYNDQYFKILGMDMEISQESTLTFEDLSFLKDWLKGAHYMIALFSMSVRLSEY